MWLAKKMMPKPSVPEGAGEKVTSIQANIQKMNIVGYIILILLIIIAMGTKGWTRGSINSAAYNGTFNAGLKGFYWQDSDMLLSDGDDYLKSLSKSGDAIIATGRECSFDSDACLTRLVCLTLVLSRDTRYFLSSYKHLLAAPSDLSIEKSITLKSTFLISSWYAKRDDS